MSPALAITLVVLAMLVALGAAFGVTAYLARRWRREQDRRAAEAADTGLDADTGLEPPALHPEPAIQPIVLVHGVLGFDHVAVLGQKVVYFRGIADLLRAHGATVYTAKLPPLSSVPDRARALAEFVDALPCDRVNLVAHSMGGLDSRYALARLGLADKVSSLITIATPHRGTPLADLIAGVAGLMPMRALRAMVGQVGLDTAAVDWLTTHRTGVLNRDIEDIADILYGSIVGRTRRRAILGNPVLLSGHLYIAGRAGDNDGMVPITSQCWGEIIDEIDADHWAQIGWSRSYDVAPVYRRLIDHLRHHGL